MATPSPTRSATIVEKHRLTPHMVRIVASGPGLAGFSAGRFSDHYIKLQLPPPGAVYDASVPVDEVRKTQPLALWPKARTYTVRAWDEGARCLTVDIVVHGAAGVAGPWAARVAVGDVVQFRGPGGTFSPDPSASWHLFVGDLSALPAIAASVERLAVGARAVVLVELQNDEDRQSFHASADVAVRWVRSTGRPTALVNAVATTKLPPGPPSAFVHGEAGMVRAVREHLLTDRGVSAHALSASAYWKRRLTDEQRRAERRTAADG